MLNLTPAASWAALFIVVGLVGCVWFMVRQGNDRYGR